VLGDLFAQPLSMSSTWTVKVTGKYRVVLMFADTYSHSRCCQCRAVTVYSRRHVTSVRSESVVAVARVVASIDNYNQCCTASTSTIPENGQQTANIDAIKEKWL